MSPQPLRTAFLLLAIAAIHPTTLQAQGWGHIEGQIVFEGGPYDERLRVPRAETTAEAVIGTTEGFLDESLVIDPETKGIANVFVYLPHFEDLDPEFREPPRQSVHVIIRNARFVPNAIFVRTGQPVSVKSLGPFPHEIHLHPLINDETGVLLVAKERAIVQLPHGEKWPIKVTCDLHPHMKAYWLILDHPYAAVTDRQGHFQIKDLPAGEHIFTIWHSRAPAGYLNGALQVTVRADKTVDLGRIAFRAERFKRPR